MLIADPPTRPTRDQRRDAILSIAHAVFLEYGYAGASMSQVASRLGGSKGTLYSYFDGKEALFEALVAETCARKGAAMFDTAPHLSMQEQLHAIGCAFLRLVCSDWAIRMFQVVAAEAQRRPEIGKLFYESGPRVSRLRLAHHLDRFVADGLLAVDDTEAAAELFLTLCRGSTHLRRMLGQDPEPTPERIDTLVTRAVAQFMKLYAPA